MAPAQSIDLAQALVAEEIVRVRAEGWSGVLALAQGQVAKGLYFVDGEIAFAASTVEEDRLGAGLFRAGKITEAQFRAAMRESESSGRPLGHTFVDMGLLAEAELAEAVAAQVERIVLSALRWTTGSLRREAMERPLPADLAVSLNTSRLLLLGTRRFPDVPRLERALGPAGRRLRRVQPSPFAYDEVSPSPAERAVLAACVRSTTLGSLWDLPLPRADVSRAAYGLLVGGLIEDAPARVAPVPLGPSAAQADLTPPPPPPRTAEDAEREARALLERGQRQRGVELLHDAALRHPEATGLRRLLALTRAREDTFQPAVEKLFLSLLEREPRDAELRYALASYYRRGGLPARAVLQLRLVLSADPTHAAAWRDLGELEAGGRPRR